MSKIAIMGYGTVGSGTVELFYKHKDKLCRTLSVDLDIKYILEIRDLPDDPYYNKMIKDINIILDDPEIKIVAEVMGGLNPAFDFVMRCLTHGKSVVTSNKELVAKKGAILLKTAAENDCNFFFEASTGGAIPIIRPLHECLAADEVYSVEGILNGTTNFILTKILSENMPYEKALKLSQELGYAEKDPTADVSGADSCRKICILASLAFGKHVYPEWVYTEGITQIKKEDAEYAKAYNSVIKLIASAKRCDNGKIAVSVRPELVCRDNQLSGVIDVFNAVTVYGEAAGELMFYGRGAGKLPTASAVVADIACAAIADGTSRTQTWEDSTDSDFIADSKSIPEAFYILAKNTGEGAIKAAFGEVLYLSRENQPPEEFAFIVPITTEIELDEKISNFGGEIVSKYVING
ncbi:MAG: homoserine dehydrogenase [Ruminococcus sp.]|nr:homoserine dehydrogenase [Ruminococcus sp.]